MPGKTSETADFERRLLHRTQNRFNPNRGSIRYQEGTATIVESFHAVVAGRGAGSLVAGGRMMRRTSSGLAAALLMLGTAVASAQPPTPPAPPVPFERQPLPLSPAATSPFESPVSAARIPMRQSPNPANARIHERAAELARQRDARLESKKWAGVSPSRPPVRVGQYSADLNAHLRYPYPWGGFYFSPVNPY